jgi:ABC-2 type transport system permease protein
MLRIIIKDLKLFGTDKRAVVMTFFLPIFLISVFAMAFGGAEEQESRPMTLIVSDLDQSSISKEITAKLDSLQSLDVLTTGLDTAQRMIRTGQETAVLVFHKGFKDSIDEGKRIPMELQFDQSRTAEIGLLQQALMSNLMSMIGTNAIMKKQMEKVDKQFGMVDTNILKSIHAEIEKSFAESNAGGGRGDGISLQMTPLIEEKQSNPGLIHAVAGTAVMMLLFGVAAMGARILEEKESGTLKRLLYSPIDPSSVILGKMASSMLISLFQLSIMFLFAAFVFKLDLTQNVPALITMLVTTAFACSGFGTFLASVARTRSQVNMLSTMIVLSMSAIGGSMIPSFIMPSWMQSISVVSVNYWSIQGFYDIYWRGLAFSDPAFLMRPIVLTCIGLVMTGISLYFYKKNVLKMT